MATTVRATCPECGDIRTTSEEVTLILVDSRDDVSQYRFRCPQCQKIVLKEATPAIVALLSQSGVKTVIQELPLELLERPTEIDAAPIDLDDVLNLGLALQNEEEWWAKMIGGSGDEGQSSEDDS